MNLNSSVHGSTEHRLLLSLLDFETVRYCLLVVGIALRRWTCPEGPHIIIIMAATLTVSWIISWCLTSFSPTRSSDSVVARRSSATDFDLGGRCHGGDPRQAQRRASARPSGWIPETSTRPHACPWAPTPSLRNSPPFPMGSRVLMYASILKANSAYPPLFPLNSFGVWRCA